MSEARYRSGRGKGFVVLYRTAAQDERLSLEARGLFALMVSLPDNWEYTVSGLAVKAGCGRDKIRRLLKELQEVGYLTREQGHDEGGKFAGNVYILQDEAPLSGNPDNGETVQTPLSGNTVNGENRQRERPPTENPLTGFPTQKNKEEKNKELKGPPKAPPGGQRGSRFELAEEAKPILRAYAGEDRELARALGEHIKIRVKLRAVNSVYAVRLLLAKLDELSGGRREDKLQLIRQSVANSWKSYFPLRGGPPVQPDACAPALVPSEEVSTW